MRYARLFRAASVAGALLLIATTNGAIGAPSDPAARGLDVFAHVPDRAGPGTLLPVQVQAYGFPTIRTPVVLPGATVEAVWDPESLGDGATTAPPPVTTTTDKDGRAHLALRMPDGPARTLRLFLGVRHGGHERTRVVTVARTIARDVSLHVAERMVVPGSTIAAWVLVRNATTQRPVPRAPVDLMLLEGGVVRSKVRVLTDAAGSAVGRVSVPFVDQPSWYWTLRARDATGSEQDVAESDVRLVPREETPGTPQLKAEWADASVRAGGNAPFALRLRDASGKPVANHTMRYWIGPKGTNPPADPKKWEAVSTATTTDPAGWVRGTTQAPTTVAPVVGTTLHLEARTKLEGQELTQRATISVGAPSPRVEVFPEAGALVGGVNQRLLLRARDERDKPIVASFALTGDGLRTTVSTNDEGEAAFTWKPPPNVGAFRAVGPCPGNVAAALVVTPSAPIAALGDRTAPVELCVPVDRESPGVLRVDPPVVREGEPVHVRMIGGGGAPWSAVLRANENDMAVSTWIGDGERGGAVTLPDGASGLWSVTTVSPGERDRSKAASVGLLAIPKVLPTLKATLAGGRAAPGGSVYVDVAMGNQDGAGLRGSVAAVVYDRYGGGSVEGLWALDTRRRLCRLAGVEVERCDRFLGGQGAMQDTQWAVIGHRKVDVLEPALDPAAHLQQTIDDAFRRVVHSLEGAVLEASVSAERMRDVRSKQGGRWDFNPELGTLVTAAMDEPPMTPGGETMTLADLVAVDRQISFDNVASRVTRLKLFRVLSAVRSYVQDHAIGPDEPMLQDPQALLRRLVRDGALDADALLDPWGGTLQFVRTQGPALPFLSLRGFALHAPGPDGRVNTGDDVRDPFQRVLRSGSPYAKAVQEDRLVDARLDMRVADATVSAWEGLIQELTGISLGSIGTIGHGGGTGTGQGFGSGHGRLGGAHRSRAPRVRYGMPTGDVVWIPPARTDDHGKVRLTIPLGAVETTWRVALVGIPDGAQPAVTMIDVPSALALSSRVDAGVSWVEGDDGVVRITVRNRTQQRVRATYSVDATGVVSLANPKQSTGIVDVPAQGATDLRVGVRAAGPGQAMLAVNVHAPGMREDVAQHRWQVHHAGELTAATQVAWVEHEADVALPVEPTGDRALGPVHVVVERGHEPLVDAALDSLRPDGLSTPEALADAVDAAVQVRRWAISRGGDADPRARRAAGIARHAVGRLAAMQEATRGNELWMRIGGRVSLEGLDLPKSLTSARVDCPPKGKPTPDAGIDWLEYEPAPVGGVVEACWDAFATDATEAVVGSQDPVALARLYLALADRTHRKGTAAALLSRLQEQVGLQANGTLELPGVSAADRASRAMVYAALLRASIGGTKLTAPPATLFAWMAVQRDAYGGYGATQSTRAVLGALLAYGGMPAQPSEIVVTDGGIEKRYRLGASGVARLTLSNGVSTTHIRVQGPPVLVKLHRRKVRLWSRSLPSVGSPLRLDVTWPSDARAGVPTKVQVSLRQDLGRATVVDVRVPLPAGAYLAAPVSGVRQVQGVLSIRRDMNKSALPVLIELPIQFGMAGRFTVPEAHARLALEEAERTTAPARPVVVR